MEEFTQAELQAARRAIASTLGKSEKALQKLRTGTVQHTMTARGVKAYILAIALIDRVLGADGTSSAGYEKEELEVALAAILWGKGRVEKILPKFQAGTPQHTLAVRRIRAFEMAAALMHDAGGEFFTARGEE